MVENDVESNDDGETGLTPDNLQVMIMIMGVDNDKKPPSRSRLGYLQGLYRNFSLLCRTLTLLSFTLSMAIIFLIYRIHF